MTVAANSRRREYTGNGTTTIFNGPMAYEKAHVFAYVGEEGAAVAIPPSAYTVERFGQESGTRVIFDTPPAAGAKLTILRTMPYAQDVDVTNQGAFHAETIEKGYDALAMQIQQLADGSMQLIFDPDEGDFVWDAKGHRIVRVGDAINLTDAMNLRSVLVLIEQIIGGGGTVGVQPKLYQFVGDGEQAAFWMTAADVGEATWYDTYIENTDAQRDFIGQEPGVDFTIDLGVDDELGPGAWITFAEPPGDGIRVFTVLRGYARPYIGDLPITTLDLNIFDVTGATAEVTADMKWGLGRCSNLSGCELTIPVIDPLANDRMKTGSFVSFKQQGFGQVEVLAAADVVLQVPEGCLPATRAARSVITLTCEDADSNIWLLSGDLALVS